MDGPVSRPECKRAATPEKLDSDNREHLAFSDRYGWVIRKENWFGLEGPACAAWRMWWWWSLRQKLQRNSRNYTSTWLFPADISGAQTRINIQIAPLFLGSRLSQQLRTSKRQIKRAMDGHSSGGIGLVKLCLKWQGYKKQGCFDVPSSQLRSTAAHRLPSSGWAAQYSSAAIKYSTKLREERTASCRGSDRGRSSIQDGAVFGTWFWFCSLQYDFNQSSALFPIFTFKADVILWPEKSPNVYECKRVHPAAFICSLLQPNWQD